jgi:type IV secretory pathway TrbD component
MVVSWLLNYTANARKNTCQTRDGLTEFIESLSRPLTILGAERKLFFLAMCLGAATFNLLASPLGGILMFLLLYFAARWATQTDPQILRLPTVTTRLDSSLLWVSTVAAAGRAAGTIGSGRNSTPDHSPCSDLATPFET